MSDVRTIAPKERLGTNRLTRASDKVAQRLGDLLESTGLIGDVLRRWGWAGFGLPPEGTRWVTPLEYRVEYVNPNTTPQRRQQIVAIRCGLLTWETVDLPPRVPV